VRASPTVGTASQVATPERTAALHVALFDEIRAVVSTVAGQAAAISNGALMRRVPTWVAASSMGMASWRWTSPLPSPSGAS
jgi:DUF1365 family protein